MAPVTRRSGKSCVVLMRQACSQRLRDAVYHWSRVAVQGDATCKARYQALRKAGHTHGRALRTVGDRLLEIATLGARLIFAGVFLLAAAFKFAGMGDTAAYIPAAGFPSAPKFM